MPTKIDKPVQVLAWCDSLTCRMIPHLVRWDGQDYLVKEVGFEHSFRTGRDHVHVYTVNVAPRGADTAWPGPLDMRLQLFSVSKIWKLIYTSDADFH